MTADEDAPVSDEEMLRAAMHAFGMACATSLTDRETCLARALVLAERRAERLERERDEARTATREAAQTLIEAIGAPGPEYIGDTAKRARARIAELEREAEQLARPPGLRR